MRNGAFGSELRRRRLQHGLSQMELANRSGTTQRHLSHLERDLAQPGRSLVLRLATSLDLPPRERDDLLLAAGLAPSAPINPPLEPRPELLEAVLEGHLPAPALIIGPQGEVVAANAAVRMLTEGTPPRDPGDLYRLLAPRVADPDSWGLHMLEALRDLARSARLQDVIAELTAYVPAAKPDAPPPGFALPLVLRSPRGELRLISTITSLAAAGHRLQVFLPADGATADLLRRYCWPPVKEISSRQRVYGSAAPPTWNSTCPSGSVIFEVPVKT